MGHIDENEPEREDSQLLVVAGLFHIYSRVFFASRNQPLSFRGGWGGYFTRSPLLLSSGAVLFLKLTSRLLSMHTLTHKHCRGVDSFWNVPLDRESEYGTWFGESERGGPILARECNTLSHLIWRQLCGRGHLLTVLVNCSV